MGGISDDGKTDLVVLADSTTNARRYIDDVLQPHVIPYAGAVGPDFILMQDNARPHTARITQQFLDREGIEVLEWPANSPDLNPIEHLWDHMQRKLYMRTHQPSTLGELKDALLEIWSDLHQDLIRRLVRSMRRRIESVIRANGNHTSY